MIIHLAVKGKNSMQKKNINQNISVKYGWTPTHITAAWIGVFFGLFSGMNHGFFEILQGSKPTPGLLIHAIGEAQKFWPLGSEDAFTLIPNFLITGITSMIVGLAIIVWSIGFLHTRHGAKVYLGLFILSFLVGGGIGQVFFFLPAWVFASRMHKPHTWWDKNLPQGLRPLLQAAWLPMLVLATLSMLVGLEMAIFGYFPGLSDPVRIQDTAMGFVFSSAFLFVLTFITAITRELEPGESKEKYSLGSILKGAEQ